MKLFVKFEKKPARVNSPAGSVPTVDPPSAQNRLWYPSPMVNRGNADDFFFCLPFCGIGVWDYYPFRRFSHVTSALTIHHSFAYVKQNIIFNFCGKVLNFGYTDPFSSRRSDFCPQFLYKVTAWMTPSRTANQRGITPPLFMVTAITVTGS